MFRKIALNSLLVFASLLFSFGVVEFSLRVLFPRYEQAAAVEYNRDTLRIWSPRANRRYSLRHSTTGVEHPVIYNNLGLRQSREMEELNTTTNVAFFGDSYTANLSLPSQYSFTEPLDYLLNESGSAFNVLNFGVNGYGTGQSYLHYLAFDRRGELDYVFYLLCANDLRNIYENNLFSLSEDGDLKRNPPAESPWWISIASRLHTTYLAIELRQRLLYRRTGGLDQYREALEELGMKSDREQRVHSQRADALQVDFLQGEDNEDLKRTLVIFRHVLERWREAVESHGSQFAVVLLPTGREELFLPLIGSDFAVISLYERFDQVIPNFSWKALQFETENDSHWAEEGNMRAAIEMYRVLERELDLRAIGEDELRTILNRYYSAFTNGWTTQSTSTAATSPTELERIRAKYISLELESM